MTIQLDASGTQSIQTLLAGPILRRMQSDRITLWLATSKPVQWRLALFPNKHDSQVHEIRSHCRQLKVAERFYIHLIDLPLDMELPLNTWVGYELGHRSGGDEEWINLIHEAPHLLYPGKTTLGFVIQNQIKSVLHGSCRKPHYTRKEGTSAGDGLARADRHLLESSADPTQWPALLVMSGDQVYTDDVAGPMLVAIHHLLSQLQDPVEELPGTKLTNSQELHQQQPHYYTRHELLPKTEASRDLRTVLFTGVKKPVFTTDNARNHLISLAEVMAMYLLAWSPIPWRYTDMAMPSSIPTEFAERYDAQLAAIEEFVAELDSVHRLMAHLPVAMMFDDHDITDDWNLSADWEETAYGEPFSRRIIGNALLAYLVCQGWGNAPENFSDDMMQRCDEALQIPGQEAHEELIGELIAFRGWQYKWNTEPVLMVIDTRTNRWRAEFNPSHPSGLMDWEALSELQQRLLGHDAVLLVSPAPMFGVKLIEGIQKIFTWFGKPLMVDAENWMAHRGAASTLLNLFRHGKTPQNFVILSGDVHYSFAYEVELRAKKTSPNIWQITSSGFRNEFPRRLLDTLDRLNRWLYAPWSPLNWFTKRRKMRIIPRKPDHGSRGERLVNGSGVGLLTLDSNGAPLKIMQLMADGDCIYFEKRLESEAH
ncbi:alkaline phosphatase D family protein [Limnobacter parvus]|uniref:Alkaline phosphatase family protein n=1 Tax=Limnobacter parvus TaxID=2939690 RepID=A0ABT1XKL0_9BURK|nr:alkaline phosphatase D family protein [Limnobacter parvus]MCR2747837.1 alkaline phosphatase family protein [Limnobacter parvus]